MAKPNYERLGISPELWVTLSADDQEKLKSQQWTKKPCTICGKDVAVLKSHEGDTWCMEHRGKWGQE